MGGEYGSIVLCAGNRAVTAQILTIPKTMIHEYTHYRYNIWNCQHAEAICFAYEKMHNENRAFLYDDEWEYVKGLAIYAYPAYNWEQGGYGDYEQFDFVRSRNKKG